jgi:transposase-like protein
MGLIISYNIIKMIEIMQNFLNNDNACIDYLVNMRWVKMKYCPYCKSTQISKHKEQNRRSRLQCSACKKSFSPTVHTIHLLLYKWVLAISMIADAKKGISSRQLARHLDLPVKTAYSLSQRIRKGMVGSISPFLQGIVEIDETYIGGKPRYKNNSNKIGRGCDKMKVIGAVERKGKVIAKSSDKFNQKIVKDLLIENINLDKSEIHTDEYRIYSRVNKMVKHEVVNNGEREYARGNIHTNSIEGYYL